MIYGYVRPLYDDADCKDQLKKINSSDITIFQEAHGAPKKRIELERMLMDIQMGDTVIVEKMFVLADTSRHLMELLKLCEKDGVTIHFINEGINSNELLSISLQDMVDFFIHFQTDIVKQSTTLGIVHAKERGKSIGRPKKSDDNVKKAITMYHSGKFTLLDIKNETGISKSTLYRYLETTEEEK